MTTYQFANNASSTLGSGISPTATAIVVATGTGAQFPAPAAGQYFTATLIASGSSTGLPNEIVRVTARAGDTMTVVRGQEGTTAQSWNVGDTFANFVTAGFLNQLVDSGSLQAQAGNYAVDSGTANAGIITLVPVPLSLASLIGVPIRVKKSGAVNTGTYALNVNSFGAVAVLIGGLPLFGGELADSRIFEVVYNGTSFDLQSPPRVINGQQLVANSVTNAILATVGPATLKGNLTGATAPPYDVPLADLISQLGIGLVSSNSNGFYFHVGQVLVQGGLKSVTNSVFNFPIPFPVGILGFYTSNANSMGRFTDPAYGSPISNTQYFLGTKASDDGHLSNFACWWLSLGE